MKEYDKMIEKPTTKPKNVEIELEEERFLLRQYFDNLPLMAYNISLDGKIVDINKMALKKLDYESKNELIGKPLIAAVYAPSSKNKAKQILKAWQKGKKVENEELQIISKDGEIIDVLLNVDTILDSNGTPFVSISTHLDITDRKKAEEELQRSEEKYRELVENLDVIISASDQNFRFTYMSPCVEKILGYTPDEIIGMPVEDMIHPEDRERRHRKIEEILQGKIYPSDYRMQTKDGEYRWIRALTHPVFKGNMFVGLRGVLTDVTEQKQVEEEREKLHAQLAQAHKMEAIGTLAGGIAHEFNNILGIIIGNNELATDHIPEWSPARECVEEIRTASIRAKDVIRQILSFARKSHIEKKPIKIDPIIEDTLKLLRSSIPKTIDIHYETECEQDTILADPIQINQILMNLCTNAFQAMSDEDGLITVNLQNVELKRRNKALDLEPGNYIKLTVKDTGQGIDPKVMDRIFEPYFTTKRLSKGTGMGLAVVHGIVQSCDGAVTVESELWEGSVFEVFLPCIGMEVLEEIVKEDVMPTGDECILFLDDEEGLVRAYTRGLESLGYDVVPFSDPLEALEAFQKDPERFDLVITDMAMPKLSGDKLAREMMEIRPDIPVILCTGYSERISEDEALAMDINAYALKPLIKKDLAKTIRRVLDNK